MTYNVYMLSNQPLTPVDGRYVRSTSPLRNYLSEAALNRERIFVEIKWAIALSKELKGLEPFNEVQIKALESIVENFNDSCVKWLSDKEKITQHDVKAVEYFLHEKIADMNIFTDEQLQKVKLAIHFCCTSEDINNLSYALCVKKAVQNVYIPALKKFIEDLTTIANNSLNTPMLAKTHGQSATPTTLGKELAVFVHRLKRKLTHLERQEYLGKINGATGTFGAHEISAPYINWPKFAKRFVEEDLQLTYNPLTTQIESHDWQVEVYDIIAHIGRILHNFATDIWIYVSNEVFGQIPVEGATGSSTMPHKINPIKFENAEANLEISDALFSKLSETLPTSRMQRDLTDSSTQRNISVAFAHALIAISNLTDGISKLKIREENLLDELEKNPAVLAEAVQSAMRAQGIEGIKGMENPYEKLKELTRGKEISLELLHKFIESLNFDSETKERLLDLTPQTYIGLASQLGKQNL